MSSLLLLLLLLFMSHLLGRYSSGRWGYLMNAKLAWCLQELPSLVIPLLFFIFNRKRLFSNSTSNNNEYRSSFLFVFDSEAVLALTLMISHYANRSILYPMRMSNRASRVPFFVFLLAFLFCTWNGLTQGAYLALVAEHRFVLRSGFHSYSCH